MGSAVRHHSHQHMRQSWMSSHAGCNGELPAFQSRSRLEDPFQRGSRAWKVLEHLQQCPACTRCCSTAGTGLATPRDRDYTTINNKRPPITFSVYSLVPDLSKDSQNDAIPRQISNRLAISLGFALGGRLSKNALHPTSTPRTLFLQEDGFPDGGLPGQFVCVLPLRQHVRKHSCPHNPKHPTLHPPPYHRPASRI